MGRRWETVSYKGPKIKGKQDDAIVWVADLENVKANWRCERKFIAVKKEKSELCIGNLRQSF